MLGYGGPEALEYRVVGDSAAWWRGASLETGNDVELA